MLSEDDGVGRRPEVDSALRSRTADGLILDASKEPLMQSGFYLHVYRQLGTHSTATRLWPPQESPKS